jgi:hypothetical protein
VIHRDHVQGWKDAGAQVLRYGLRVIATRIKVTDDKKQPTTVFVVSGYSPIGSAPDAERAAYALHLQKAIDDCGVNEFLVLGTDANALAGRRSKDDDPFSPGRDKVRGPFGVPYQNKAGKELCTLLGINELCLTSTYFEKKEYATWKNPCNTNWHQLDHVCVRQKHLRSVTNAGRVGQPGKNSDHFAVFVEIRISKTLKRKLESTKPVRVNLNQPGGPVREDSAAPGVIGDDFIAIVKEEYAKPKGNASSL